MIEDMTIFIATIYLRTIFLGAYSALKFPSLVWRHDGARLLQPPAAARRSLTRRTIHESGRDKYRGRSADQAIHARIVALRGRGETIANTARLAGTSVTTVKRVWAAYCARSHGN